jgi:3-dehydroquinate synthase
MKTVTVNASKKYNIWIERGIISDCGKYICQSVKSKRFAVITDDIVDKLYSDTVINSMKEYGLEAVKFVFKNGEASKCSETLNQIYMFLCDNNITRSDCIIALGGGVTGDMAGYASGTFMRGLPYIQIPTTLLAQIDSSVGGKTAIDLPCGKNLVGVFKQPECVICDPDTLDTLKPETLSDGMAEAIKYGMIREKSLFDLIASHNLENVKEAVEEIIFRCVSIKRDVVENDEFDRGERMILNFGHTVGHAIESFYNYEKYTHGSAVAVGMILITERAVKNGVGSNEMLEKLTECIKAYNLPYCVEADMKQLAPLCLNDKKRESTHTNIIICDEIGVCHIVKLSIDEFMKYMGV